MFDNGDDIKRVNVFIPAAGLGERLRPITEHIPKPLLPILGKPSIQYVLDNIAALPFNKIGINIHHRKESIEAWMKQSPLHDKIALFPEEEILGTGGALKNAEGLLRERTFLVHNSDILSDIDLKELLKRHFSSGNLVTLAVHNCTRFNNVIIDGEGSLKAIGKEFQEDRRVAFTGIAVYEPAFLDYLPPGKSSVVEAWLKAVASGSKIGTYDVSGCYWSDIGTPDTYASAVFHELRREGEVVYIHPSFHKCADADIQGNVVIEEGCLIEGEISLKNCILLPGCRVGAIHELPLQSNCIIGPGFKVDLNEREIIPFVDEGKQLIGTGGSDRRYCRVREGSGTAVLMQCREDDPDFERHIEYARFFLKHSIPVPFIIKADLDRKLALFEDAGDISLYTWLKYPRETKDIGTVYRKVIDALSLIHSVSTDNAAGCALPGQRIFDYDHFRWETDYFIERYVRTVRSIRIVDSQALQAELDHLARKADSFPKTIVHRDFQSQNIMVNERRGIRVIDFQGARIGPPAYDIASLLWDPYYRIEDNLREGLLNYYIDKMKAQSGGKFDEDIFTDSLAICRLQRHMQALGAYGFLSSVKGKKYFLKYVPEGLRLLKDDAFRTKDDCPELYNLIMGL